MQTIERSRIDENAMPQAPPMPAISPRAYSEEAVMRKLDDNRRARAEFERRYVVGCIKLVPRAH